uniref:Zn-dependent protease with chaperone function n=1 Tax=Candidatus Kentrum sp. SD TaxID=2126332 RepID=A0A450YVV5_9GAMM|nr:MAG: Zn-dependent protease with chaperone function [Candidatus Kentron sp. SD]VFK45662.1 MAG: Zn-dependent protease with chaperone function [Candidatus Kentron sp. SD]VFK79062.1 MAG: Zn-dependent protease with chaperone function [Candidatus Kentron sp. SD]
MKEIEIQGEFFEPLSPKSQEARMIMQGERIAIWRGKELLIDGLEIRSIQQGESIFFRCGRQFRAKTPLPATFLTARQTKAWNFIAWLEEFSLAKTLALSLTLLALIFAYRFVFMAFGETMAQVFPDAWERQIGRNAYRGMALLYFSESDIPMERQEDIQRRVADMTRKASLTENPEILFHAAPGIGPNAMAFPGGPIVVTDELVTLLDVDEELLGVIAHELAHLEYHHSLEQIIDIVGVSVLAALLFGADDTIIEEISTIAINVWAFKNSRDFEREADSKGAWILEKAEISKTHFLSALGKLVQHACREKSAQTREQCIAGTKSGWLSSHPPTAIRIESLSER